MRRSRVSLASGKMALNRGASRMSDAVPSAGVLVVCSMNVSIQVWMRVAGSGMVSKPAADARLQGFGTGFQDSHQEVALAGEEPVEGAAPQPRAFEDQRHRGGDAAGLRDEVAAGGD